jgi:hypothetical protein
MHLKNNQRLPNPTLVQILGVLLESGHDLESDHNQTRLCQEGCQEIDVALETQRATQLKMKDERKEGRVALASSWLAAT